MTHPSSTTSTQVSTRGATSPDDQLVALWLHDYSPHTQAAYTTAVAAFRRGYDAPLAQVTLADLQAFADQLDDGGLAPASRRLRLTALKSLLSFGNRIGILPVNVGAAVKVQAGRSRLAERILTEQLVQKLLVLETNPRNHALLRLLYASGLRVSEATGLCWRDLSPAGDAGIVTVWGKGSKERAVRLPASVFAELLSVRDAGAGDDTVIFSGKNGGQLHRTTVERIVTRAARRAGIDKNVSPHWLRHALASHALDRGAPIHVVQATLGHSSLATTSKYSHARPGDSAGLYVAV
jgi:integrase/recombinase XerD